MKTDEKTIVAYGIKDFPYHLSGFKIRRASPRNISLKRALPPMAGSSTQQGEKEREREKRDPTSESLPRAV